MLDYVIAFGVVSGFMGILYSVHHVDLMVRNWWMDMTAFYDDMMHD
jgi:hypothetical protein